MSAFTDVFAAAQIPAEDLTDVKLAANRRMNQVGGRPSDAARSAVSEDLATPEAFRAGRALDRAEDARVRELEQAARWGWAGVTA